ncbi:hypothetical protein [Polaromonas sp. YR568]|uniref:hypothetical protein n=1 Tax=Polaromonas sp. YR568 TaxID=1855301 RepID=UPI00398BDA5A
MNKSKPKTFILVLLPVLAVLAGVFVALGPVQDHANSILLVVIFYVLCVWIWRVMLALGLALAMGWGLGYVVSANAGYLSLALLVLGFGMGIAWHVRHRRSIEKGDEPLDKIS